MGFDDERYARDVLEPSRLADNTPPADLLLRYGLSPVLTAEDIAGTLPQVLGCWRRARRELKYRRLVSRLEADHAHLAPAFDRAMAGDLGPLQARIDEATQAGREHTRRLQAEITDLAAPVGRITPGLAAELAAGHGVPSGELATVLNQAGVRVIAPDQLPRQPPISGYPRYRDALRTLGCRHTADFLLHDRRDGAPTPTGITVWDGVGVTGRSGRQVGPETVTAVDRSWAARPHDGSRTLASTVLVALKALVESHGVAGITELVRYEVAEELRARHRQGASATALVEYTVDRLGMARDPAQRMAFAVRSEPHGVPQDPSPPPAPNSPSDGASFDPAASPTSAEVPQQPDPLPPATAEPTPPTPTGVTAERIDNEVVIRWQWPARLAEATLRWRVLHDGHAPWRHKAVSRGGYRSQDGAWLPLDDLGGLQNAPLEVQVVPVLGHTAGSLPGPPVTVVVPGRVQAWYEVTRAGPPWRRELSVVVHAAQPAQLPTLRVVVRKGTVMPLHPADGEVLRRIDDLWLSPDEPLRLRLPAPRGPYWLRCFASAGGDAPDPTFDHTPDRTPDHGPDRSQVEAPDDALAGLAGARAAGPTATGGSVGVVVELRDPPVAQLRGR